MTSRQKYKQLLKKINSLEKEFETFKKDDFSAKKEIFKMRLKAGWTLEKILPEAYALVREAVKKTLGLRAFDVQILGAIAAHFANIVEMKTGEGKTLTIVFPAYLNSLTEKGVHIVTTNDYLAQRDAIWMKPVYDILGININFITSQSNSFDRQVAYASDITYTTNKEICFDFLKDNMVYDFSDKRHRNFNYAIIDEVDSVLIDEAQIPLIISSTNKKNEQQNEKDKKIFIKLNKIIKNLIIDKDFKINKKKYAVYLTFEGIRKLEKLIKVDNLYQESNEYIYYIECLLKAHYLFRKNKDYIIDEDKVIIVDEFTGRIMPDHRYFQGIHQAIEAKENVKLGDESEVMAITTFQHFFKYYKKIAGFTGTAKTAEKEFRLLYNKNVFVVPTNKPIIRQDLRDRFFLFQKDKIDYLTWSVQEYFFKNRAVLIGTRSVEKSKQAYEELLKENIPSNVLNAKHITREAEIVAQAGQPQAVTVATNMAGRGTDIELNDEVKEKGGLVIFGTERHNARRIDDQLVGRGGRQGDPGQSQFLISADDSLINVYFKKDYENKIKKLKNYKNGVTSRRLEKIIKKAQKRTENIYFDQRVLNYEFDKILDKQRNDFYSQRNNILKNENLRMMTEKLILKNFFSILKGEFKEQKMFLNSSKTIQFLTEQEILEKIKKKIYNRINNGWFNLNFDNRTYSPKEIKEKIKFSLEKYYNDFENYYSVSKMRILEKTVILKIMDLLWINHLKKADEFQDAALISAISNENFFEEYELKMDRAYFQMLNSITPAISITFFRTINNLWHK